MNGSVRFDVNEQGRIEVYCDLDDDFGALCLAVSGTAYLMANIYRRIAGTYDGLDRFREEFCRLAQATTERTCQRVQSGDVRLREVDEDEEADSGGSR